MPEPPTQLKDKPLKVRYTSQIAKAQLSAEGDQVVKAMQLIAPFIDVIPESVDNLDGDAIVRFSAKIFGLPHEILRDKKDVKSLREQRAQAQAQEAELQQAQAEADIANKTQGVENV
jgi:adenine specific DNA methylase Mod